MRAFCARWSRAMSTLEDQRRALLDAAQQIINRAKTAGRPMTSAERADVQAKLDEAETLLKQISEQRDEAELRRRIGAALSDEPVRLGDIGVFSAKTAAPGLVKQISDGMHGAK